MFDRHSGANLTNKRSLLSRLFTSLDPLVLTAVGLVLLYLAWSATLPHGVFETVDEGGKVLYIQNVLRTGDPASSFLYPGRSIDPEGLFFPTWWRLQRGSQFYTWWQPGFPLLTLPFFSLFGWFGLYIIPALSGGMVAYLSGLLLRELGRVTNWLAVVCALVVGLSTPVMFYSANFHEHTLATALLLASVITAMRSNNNYNFRLSIASGVLASLAVFIRTETVTLLFAVGLVLLIANWRLGLQFATAFFLTSVPWMILNLFITGNLINNHVSSPFDVEVQNRATEMGLRLIPAILFGQPGVGALAPTRLFLLLATSFTITGLVLQFVKPVKAFAALAFLATAAVCSSQLFSEIGYRTIHGLVTISPQILFAAFLFSFPQTWKRSLFPSMLLVGGLTFAGVYIYRAWLAAGGIQWGPRYMLSFYPLLVVSALIVFHEIWPSEKIGASLAFGGSFLICTLVGLGFEIRGWYTNRTVLSLYQQSAPALIEKSDTTIISHYCDPPLHIPDLYWQQIFMSTSRSGEQAWVDADLHGPQPFIHLDSWDLCSAAPFTEIIEQRNTNPSGLTFSSLDR